MSEEMLLGSMKLQYSDTKSGTAVPQNLCNILKGVENQQKTEQGQTILACR